MQLLSIPGVASPDTYAAADGANADGTVIVGYVASKTSGTATDPVAWDLSGSHLLRDLLVGAGVSASSFQGWTLGGAGGVSADGKVVAGGGTNQNGQGQAWIARLP
jgi:uncharacterized membrane protein